ncbi:MAG: ferritin [Oscillospiraceae bacterium]|nr:ferritin [Oscillospiraceae bacterium]
MLDATVAKLLNEQINAEFYSAYLYLDFSNYYKDESLDGYANWFYVQAQEERDHAVLILQYMQRNDEKITLEAIAKPNKPCEKLSDPLEYSLEHERYVTSLIHRIYGAALAVNDFRTMQFLDWFVKEQVEEEDNADTNLKRFRRFGSDTKALYDLDNEMSARTYTAPSLTV